MRATPCLLPLFDLNRDGFELLTAAKDVAYIARQLSAQPRRPRGFQLLNEEKTDGRSKRSGANALPDDR